MSYLDIDGVAIEPAVQTDESDVESDHSVEEVEESDETIEQPIRPAWKPDISHMQDAVQLVDSIPTLILGVGSRVVIDYSGLKYGPWLDTRCWTIQSIGHQGDPGYLGLYDPSQKQQGCSNWMTAKRKGILIKVAGKSEEFIMTAVASSTSRKGARKAVAKALKEEKHREEAEAKAKNRLALAPDSPKSEKGKGRGRPKGTLNSRTVERLKATGHDPAKLTRPQVDEIMAKIRKDEYEQLKSERKRNKEAQKRNGK